MTKFEMFNKCSTKSELQNGFVIVDGLELIK